MKTSKFQFEYRGHLMAIFNPLCQPSCKVVNTENPKSTFKVKTSKKCIPVRCRVMGGGVEGWGFIPACLGVSLGGCLPRGVCPGSVCPRGVHPIACLNTHPSPVNSMTHVCINTTLSQTSFAGGKNQAPPSLGPSSN